MKRLAGIILAGLILLTSCTRGAKLTREYDITVGSTTYTVEVYSDSTKTISRNGEAILHGNYDTVYAFNVKDRHYMGIDRYDDLMEVYDEDMNVLLDADRGVQDIFFAVSDRGRRFGFINVRDSLLELMDEDFHELAIPACDNLHIRADVFDQRLETAQERVWRRDTVEYVILTMGDMAGIVDMDGRILVPMQPYDAIGLYKQKYYSDPNSLESYSNLSLRHSGEYGDCTAPMGFYVDKDEKRAVYGLDGTLIVPHGAIYCWPVFWDDPNEARYWRATYPTTGTGTQKEGVYRKDGKCILPPMHHMGLFLLGEDKQVSEGKREPHRIEAYTGFSEGRFTKDIYDYEGHIQN